MKGFALLACIGLTASVAAAPKFGIVRVTDIYRNLPSTAAMQKELQAQREALAKNARAENLRTGLTELTALEARLREMKDDLGGEVGKKLIRDYEIKRQEAETLRQEFENFRAEEEMRINREMIKATRASLDRITAAAVQLAKERNLDGVFDTSGNTNTGLPLLLYTANSVDLTDDVVVFLGEKAPVEPAPSAPPAEGQAKPE